MAENVPETDLLGDPIDLELKAGRTRVVELQNVKSLLWAYASDKASPHPEGVTTIFARSDSDPDAQPDLTQRVS